MPKEKDTEKRSKGLWGMIKTPLCMTAVYSKNRKVSFQVGGIDSIVCYSTETMSFRSGSTTVTFCGSMLECSSYSNKTVEVTGRVESVHFKESNI